MYDSSVNSFTTREAAQAQKQKVNKKNKQNLIKIVLRTFEQLRLNQRWKKY